VHSFSGCLLSGETFAKPGRLGVNARLATALAFLAGARLAGKP
jgi:hypothetical protein